MPVIYNNLEIGDVDTLIALAEFDNEGELTDNDIDTTQALENMELELGAAARAHFRVKSNFIPLLPHDNIDTFHDCTIKALVDLRQKNRKQPGDTQKNLSYTQRQALKSLHDDTNIVIRPADKGGNIVIQDWEDYINEAL